MPGPPGGCRQPEGWYAVALSSEVPASGPVGTDFLGGRVVVYRKASGEPVVMTARCPHMGADLALGDVVDDTIRCTYHHFCFGPDGRCARIPSEGPIPSAARLAISYPTHESFGLVWAYNGDTPLFPPPTVREGQRRGGPRLPGEADEGVFEVAPWLSIGNTFDFMHLRYVHDLDFRIEPEDVRYVDDHHIELEIPFVSKETGAFEQRIRVTGTNVVSFQTVTDHTTIGIFTSTPIGTTAQTYYVAAVPKDQGLSDADLDARLAEQQKFGDDLLVDDARTLQGIRFKVGSLVAGDRAMVTAVGESFPDRCARRALPLDALRRSPMPNAPVIDLAGRIALVTGAGSRHRTRQRRFATPMAGAAVMCADIDADGAKLTAETIRGDGGEAASLQLDVTDETAVEKSLQQTVDALGGFDIALQQRGHRRHRLPEDVGREPERRLLRPQARLGAARIARRRRDRERPPRSRACRASSRRSRCTCPRPTWSRAAGSPTSPRSTRSSA